METENIMPTDEEPIKVICGDCLEVMKKIPDNSVDLVLTDPPYGINYKSNHGSKEYKDRIQTAQKWDNNFDFSLLLPELIRITKRDSYILVFGCEENIKLMKELGCYQVLVWDKMHCGMGDLSDFGIGYEFIFYFKKGNPCLRGGRINGVVSLQHIGYFDKTLHPTQKSLKLVSLLIKKCSDKNNLVLDCCLGSGTTAVACKQLGRKCLGIEISEDYCKIVRQRLAQEVLF